MNSRNEIKEQMRINQVNHEKKLTGLYLYTGSQSLAAYLLRPTSISSGRLSTRRVREKKSFTEHSNKLFFVFARRVESSEKKGRKYDVNMMR